MGITTTTDWYEIMERRAAVQIERAQESKLQVHELPTTIGTVYLTFESANGDHLEGSLWTVKPVRVNNHDYRISGRFHYFQSTGHWESGTKRVHYDTPRPCASFSSADMMREGNHQATSNANIKAELAIGAAIAKYDKAKDGLLHIHARLNETELTAQEQDRLARRCRERAAEWLTNAERHEHNAAAIRKGETVREYDLQERRVY